MKSAGFLPTLALIATMNAIVTYFYESVIVNCLSQCGTRATRLVKPAPSALKHK